MKYIRAKYLVIPVILLFFAILFYFFQPTWAFAQDAITAENSNRLELFPKENSSLTDFRVYVSNFYFFSIGASILIAVMMMMIGGVIWLTSAGNPGRISTAKEYIINALIGVVLLLGAYTIIQAVNPRLVNLEDPNLPPIPSTGACLYASNGKARCKTEIESYCTQELKGQYKKKVSCSDKSVCSKYNIGTSECIKTVAEGTVHSEEGNACNEKVFTFNITVTKDQASSKNQTPIQLAGNLLNISCRDSCRAFTPSDSVGQCIGRITSTASQGGDNYRSTCECSL